MWFAENNPFWISSFTIMSLEWHYLDFSDFDEPVLDILGRSDKNSMTMILSLP